MIVGFRGLPEEWRTSKKVVLYEYGTSVKTVTDSGVARLSFGSCPGKIPGFSTPCGVERDRVKVWNFGK
jgi:hypothetical protein